MTTIINAQAIEAAARAICGSVQVIHWDDQTEDVREWCREKARIPLEAALPYVQGESGGRRVTTIINADQIKAEALRESAHEISEWIRAGADGEATAGETWQWLIDRAENLESK